MSTQIAMTGDDWTSERERASQKKAVAARRAAGLKAAKALEKASEAIHAYLMACRECQDGSDDTAMGAGDGRNILIGDIKEYMGWLYWKYETAGGAA